MIKKLFKTTILQKNNNMERHIHYSILLKIALVNIFVLFICISTSFAEVTSETDVSLGENASIVHDLSMKGDESITFQYDPNGQILMFENGFTMTVGPTEFSSEKAVIWLVKSSGNEKADYTMTAYLQGKVLLKRDSKIVSQHTEMPVWTMIDGDISITADRKKTSDPRGMELYVAAYEKMQRADIGPVSNEAKPLIAAKKPTLVSVVQAAELANSSGKENQDFIFPINLAPISEDGIKTQVENNIATLTGGFYLSQKREIDGKIVLLEMRASDAVIYLPDDNDEPNESSGRLNDILSEGVIKAIYLSGDVVMTEGQRTIRADELFYDYANQKAIVINAVMKNFNVDNGIPIYIRASKLQQLAANKFSADDAVLTTSEFYIPQISLNAASIIVTDNTAIATQDEESSKNDYDVRMRDVNLRYYDTKFPLIFPRLRTNMVRPDVPLKDFHAGNDNNLGTYVETSWYTARLLGLKEPDGTDSTLYLDYYGDRGPGGGIETEYYREDYFGKFLGYIINDHGEDRLGRSFDRKNLEPENNLRGRFFWQNRHFLPYKWQLTTELSYLSDKNFLESFYRSEYYLDKPQETLIHMKRIEDNWGLSILGKVRINDFENVLEELPTTEFHWTGQTFWDDRLTLFSDTQASRLRQRYADDSAIAGPREFFSFVSTRNEIDMPLSFDKFKFVPFVAGTVAFEDGMGFYTNIDNNTDLREDDIFIGEIGFRGSLSPLWKVFPNVKSQLWDLNQLRHVVQPRFMAVSYDQNHSVAEQRNVFNVGITQRLQTKRGSNAKQRSVDWMRLDTDFIWLNKSSDISNGADRIFWNSPFIPLINEESVFIPQQDRRGTSIYGPRHNYFTANYQWNMSDSTVFLSDMHYDLDDGELEQLNYGISHMRQPNLSYYVGSRYLRDIDNGYGQHGSNAFTYAVTYILDPRYSLVYSGQFDFDYDEPIRNDIALIRRYHRLFWSISYNRDETLDRQSIEFSLWPQGIPELGFGSSRYMNLGGAAGF